MLLVGGLLSSVLIVSRRRPIATARCRNALACGYAGCEYSIIAISACGVSIRGDAFGDGVWKPGVAGLARWNIGGDWGPSNVGSVAFTGECSGCDEFVRVGVVARKRRGIDRDMVSIDPSKTGCEIRGAWSTSGRAPGGWGILGPTAWGSRREECGRWGVTERKRRGIYSVCIDAWAEGGADVKRDADSAWGRGISSARCISGSGGCGRHISGDISISASVSCGAASGCEAFEICVLNGLPAASLASSACKSELITISTSSVSSGRILSIILWK